MTTKTNPSIDFETRTKRGLHIRVGAIRGRNSGPFATLQLAAPIIRNGQVAEAGTSGSVSTEAILEVGDLVHLREQIDATLDWLIK